MTGTAILPARQREDIAARAGSDAAAILAAAEHAVLAAMASAGTLAIRGTIGPQLAKRKVSLAAAVELGRASAALGKVYSRAAEEAAGKPVPLPDAPDQVARAILTARQDADTAFGAVLAAALGSGNGVRIPPPSSPWRRIVDRAARQGAPGKAAAAALGAVQARGLTGYVSHSGRRQPLAAYAQRVVRVSAARLAAHPVTGTIRQRREHLTAIHVAAVTRAWKVTAAGLDTGSAVTAFRADSRLASSAPDAAVARRWRQEAASSAAAGMTAGVYRSGGYTALTAALEDAVRAGMAEGEAGALAYAAERQHAGNLDMDAAAASALASLQGDYGVTRRAQEAAAAVIGGAAADVARALVNTADGSEKEARDAVQEALSGARNAASRWADFTVWAALGAGAVALYQRATSALGGLVRGVFTPVVLVTWEAQPSACVICQQNAAGSPYAPVDVPAYPAHGACRCNLWTDSSLPMSLLAQFAGLI